VVAFQRGDVEHTGIERLLQASSNPGLARGRRIQLKDVGLLRIQLEQLLQPLPDPVLSFPLGLSLSPVSGCGPA